LGTKWELLVGIVADENGFHSTEVMRERLGTAIKENKLVSGTAEMWDILTKEDRANNNQPKPADLAAVTSGCNADIRAIFLSGGSLLANVGSRLSIPTSHVNLLRGLVGDIQLEGAANGYRVATIPPCAQNNPDDLEAFTDGEVYAKSATGACTRITDAGRDLVESVTTRLNAIADKLAAKGSLSAVEQTFLEGNPLAPLPILQGQGGAREEGRTRRRPGPGEVRGRALCRACRPRPHPHAPAHPLAQGGGQDQLHSRRGRDEHHRHLPQPHAAAGVPDGRRDHPALRQGPGRPGAGPVICDLL
jgi:hypothetical protein